KDLLARLRALETNKPIFPDLDVQATWLQPRLSCEVESTGVNAEQQFQKPEFKGLLFPKQPEPAKLPVGDGKDDKKTGDGKTGPSGKKPPDGKTSPTGQNTPAGKDSPARDRTPKK